MEVQQQQQQQQHETISPSTITPAIINDITIPSCDNLPLPPENNNGMIQRSNSLTSSFTTAASAIQQTQQQLLLQQNQQDINQLVTIASNPKKILEAIIEAIKADNAKALREIYELCRPFYNHVLFRDEKTNRTPIWYAAYYGSNECLKVMKQLMFIDILKENEMRSASSDLFCASSWGTPPLLIAVARNNAETVKLLSSMITTKSQVNSYGTSATILAAHLGHLDVVKVVAHEDDVNSINQAGMTAIIAAAKNGHVEIIQYLHEHVQQVDYLKKINDDSLDCVATACYHNQASVVEYLLSLCSELEQNQPQQTEEAKPTTQLPRFHFTYGRLKDTPLHICSRCEHIETLKIFLLPQNLSKFDLTQKNNDGMTALHLAVHLKSEQVVQCFTESLSQEKLQLLTCDKDLVNDETPLVYAISRGYLPLVKLLAPFSDLTILCRLAGTQCQSPALIVAATRNNLDVIRYLISIQIDLNQTDEKGHTAIGIAARNGFVELTQILCENGANLSLATRKGGTPLQKAKRYKHFKVVEILEQYGAT